MRDLDKPVCWRLKGLMAEHGITQRELAEKSGISKSALAQKINGRRQWLYREMLAVIEQFGYKEVKQVFPEAYNAVLKGN